VRTTRKIRWCAVVSVAALIIPVAPAAAGPEAPWQFDARLVTKGAAELTAVAVLSGTEAWVAGTELDPVTGHTRALLGRWDGTLSVLPAAGEDATADIALAGVGVAGDDVWAVGRTGSGDGTVRARIERYSRTTGSGAVVTVRSPGLRTELVAVSLLSPTDGWAVGSAGSDTSTRTFIVHWDGYAWIQVPSPSPSPRHNRLNAVAALAPDDVWAVGHSSEAADPEATNTLVLHWDGVTWTQEPSPSPGVLDVDELLGVAVTRESVWAVGYTGVPDNKPEHRQAVALRWDRSTTWRVLRPGGTEPTQFSDVTAISDTDVWFAGYAMVHLTETAHIEHWDGIQLQPSTIVSPSAVSGYPATALNAIAAGPPNGPLWSVGWLASSESANRSATTLRKMP
jgi:hypothetical protein